MEIRKNYALIFPDSNLHHLIPTSRQGDGSEFNLFPYKKESHLDYHFIFWNLRVDQVWDMLEDIHCSIFESKTNYIYCWWYGFCELEKGTFKEREKFEKNKQKFLAKLMPVKTLQRRWEGAFSGYDLSTASKLMKIMLLFMIFGIKMVDEESLFDDRNLVNFFAKLQYSGYRLWAFEVCFGTCGSIQAMKSKIAGIRNRNKYYSP